MASRKKYFTVDEANHSLPLVRSIVTDIVTFYADLHDRHQRLQSVKKRNSASRGSMPTEYNEELTQMEADLQRDSEKLQGYVAELEALGVELKDLTIGLIDFPGLMEGREVCLCWKLGEPEVGFWHEIDAGFSGRQSLLAGATPLTTDGPSDPTVA
ncbi:MAG: hypothetical protein JWM11_5731 [Planctomycetaceae bacterium]|nr:hypothetical protein [Planctomycetaceae bacterium]